MKLCQTLLFCGLCCWLQANWFVSGSWAQAAPGDESNETYLLQYKFKKGETVRWDVEHVASTKTRAAGEMETSASRAVSRKAWKILDVDADGNMTFSHSFESADSWQQTGDDEPISYNSKTDAEVPYEYELTASRLGKVLAELKVTPDGQVKERKSDLKELKFGVGDITVPLPKQAIPIGQQWNIPTTFNAKDEDERRHELKARLAYQLVKVTEGHAYITFKTEILTPVESPQVQSQLMQQKTKGYMVFDIANGRMIRKEIEWNEKVQGFEGGESFLEYVAKMSEKIVEDNSQQAKSAASLTPIKLDESDEEDRVGAAEPTTTKK